MKIIAEDGAKPIKSWCENPEDGAAAKGGEVMTSRLTLISDGPNGMSLFRCSCGNEKTICKKSVMRGVTKSCGCLRKEVARTRRTTHGHSKTKAYVSWHGMKTRCCNPKATRFAEYGGRGITVCKRWETFAPFLEDMGHPPTPKHSLERIDNNRGYSPDNCIWALPAQQARNKSNTVRVELNGAARTMASLSEEYGIKRQLLWDRIVVQKMPVEKAISSRDLRRKT